MTDESQLRDLLQRGYRYALSLTHEPDQAEDLVQDAALSISRRGGPWNMPFLITIIRNRFIDVYRRKKLVPFESIDEQAYDIYEDDSLPDPVENDHMEAILAGLKPAEREILYLSAVEEYTTAEIAEMTGRPRGTVLSLLHRTKLKLRKRLTHEAQF
jgi:RNA polymerase sigma-70 factor (ECF subfamily)